jgi:hypothetical protein
MLLPLSDRERRRARPMRFGSSTVTRPPREAASAISRPLLPRTGSSPIAFRWRSTASWKVAIAGETGVLRVQPPLSRAGDYIVFEAAQDLVVGLTACSALQSNNYAFKPTHYEISGQLPPSK